jgi:sugar phosphate isomerase/epimerase
MWSLRFEKLQHGKGDDRLMKIAAMVGTPDLTQDTLAVYRGDLDIAFSKLADLGYDGVEFMTKDPSKLDGKKIRRSLDEKKLQLVGICTGHVYGEDGLGLVGPDAENCRAAMNRLKQIVDFAAAHFDKGTLINLGRSRGLGYPNDAKTSLARFEEAFRELADYAAPHGIEWVLEPINVHQANYIHTTQDGIAMVKQVNHYNFGLMLDLYHMNIEDVNIYDSIRDAKQVVKFVHFTDNNRKWPGSAHLNFEKIVSTLNEIGYDGYVSLEILPWPNPDSAARSSISHLRQYIPRG